MSALAPPVDPGPLSLRFALPARWTFLGRPGVYALGALVLTLIGSATTLAAPRLLDPARFGSFALMTTLFTYAGRADLGLSQLADKLIPGATEDRSAIAARLMQALWLTALAVLILGAPLVLLLPLPPALALLALTGGVAAMLANGPVTLFRAAGRIAEFTALALILQLGMTAPRLFGLAAGGVIGCFAALLAYYAMLALVFARPMAGAGGPSLAALFRLALPLFAFNAVWTFYLGANRLLAAGLVSAHDLGLFSFGASLAMVGLGLLSTLAQLRYPRLLAARARGLDTGRQIERDMAGLALALALVAALAIATAGRLVPLVFPGYDAAVPATLALAIACIPLGTLVWIMPVVIVSLGRPVRDALLFAAIALASLAVSMAAGAKAAGLLGVAYGNLLAALLLLFATLRLMVRGRLIAAPAAWRTGLAQSVAVALLTGFALSAGPATAGTMPKKGALIFEETFDSLSLQQGSAGRWMPAYPDGSRTNAGNREQQYYLDPRPGRDRPALQALGALTVKDGVLSITASRLPEDLRPAARGMDYVSGLLNTHRRFSFLYGTVEVRAKLPPGQGVWPAVWMLPEKLGWPPEIDVLELLGQEPGTLQVTAHSGIGVPPGQGSRKSGAAVRPLGGGDLTRAFHTYAVHWGPERIVWSFDGTPVFETETPADLHQPMFLLVNLALGGSWAGPVDDRALPATFAIDRIRVHALAKGET